MYTRNSRHCLYYRGRMLLNFHRALGSATRKLDGSWFAPRTYQEKETLRFHERKFVCLSVC
eukprot:SAG25_NODE_24_length_22161_cov_23.692405_28_plen_61_part_00